jgi:hypothetical protein
MKRILCSLLSPPAVRKRPRGCAEVEERQRDLVCQHEPPNVPGESIKGVLVECGPGDYSPGHAHRKSRLHLRDRA